MNPKLIAIGCLTALLGCGFQGKLLDASAVSMTHSSLEPDETLKETGEIAEEFCPSPLAVDRYTGALDGAIAQAQKKSGADFITNASFFRNANGCIHVTGTANKIEKRATVP
ncbi:MAG: hypothetical protein EXR75_00810 [Myxococcales bacterium]|nr:hypothetical protein [Myxococcales bacterium]